MDKLVLVLHCTLLKCRGFFLSEVLSQSICSFHAHHTTEGVMKINYVIMTTRIAYPSTKSLRRYRHFAFSGGDFSLVPGNISITRRDYNQQVEVK